ncbi:helix-turn-helix domain-containing protein [Serpentinicella sp. ANB-PHB4]|uniref:helix-turn-helix domain-containing protein n=1 Tax=Serpentinicella sp. ANB-PHB4 TaxID=3074076 RepID=UPI00285FD5FC|nr:helix-turn-helix domain-containing protein [Serpentinicella sp. ANB-PHB4]MDR5659691.1 helix-turn-helix domain-containing protein [Serpentinicella sp. ANB-PHB4]
MNTFGDQLKTLRKAKKLKQKDLATLLGVAQTTVANYENNSRFPGESVLKQIADFFQVSLDELLGREAFLYRLENTDSPLKLDHIKNQFLTKLLNQNDQEAKDLIFKAVKAGVDIKDIYKDVLAVSMYDVGYLWERGEISIVDEHFFTHTVKSLIYQLNLFIKKNPKQDHSALFALPSSELHEIPLLISKDLLEMEGWKSYYLGSTVPAYCVVEALERFSCQLLIMSATMDYNVGHIKSIIDSVSTRTKLKKVKVVVGGNAFNRSPLLYKEIGAHGFAKTTEELIDLCGNLIDKH